MTSKQAACLNCRKSKIKCKRNPGAAVCEKCDHTGTECIIPSFHIGRQKGVKNKRTGLEKAIYQIEEAIRKSKCDSVANEGTLEQLHHLLEEARNSPSGSIENAASTGTTLSTEKDAAGLSSDDQLALDDAENPLQLLARASDLRLASSQSPGFAISTPSSRHLGSGRDDTSEVHRFFLPMKASRDTGPDMDPVDVGLVTLKEAATLLSFFHERLAHTRWGLDPVVHTLEFVRSRSAFLCTSLLTASALFMHSAGALAKRLLLHRQYLAQQVIARRFRSVEIVLAFMVNVPWMHPGAHASDDDTGFCISAALSIALDLSLNKIVIPSTTFDQELLKRVPKADCIDIRKALAMDGFDDLEPRSEWAQRLVRRRERVWIALFVLERGVCLARGRSYAVPITPLIKHCDRWHFSEVSDVQDGPLISMAVLRRDLDELFSAVRWRCDHYKAPEDGSKVAREIEVTIDNFFDRWLAAWTMAIGEGDQQTLPPYVEILTTHTRLSTYSGVINHPSAPSEVKRLFRASALSSALNVMRAAIQGEGRLKSMPNNTVIMICFAACVALNLSTPTAGGRHSLAPSVRNLIDETAAVLERIGSTPSHRNGISVLYGKYLHELVQQAPELPVLPQSIQSNVFPSSQNNNTVFNPVTSAMQTFNPPQYPIANTWTEPLQFSAMSGNEVIQTVMDAGDFESAFFDMPMENINAFAWMGWMNPPDFGLS